LEASGKAHRKARAVRRRQHDRRSCVWSQKLSNFHLVAGIKRR
jgi:hypothetical protein